MFIYFSSSFKWVKLCWFTLNENTYERSEANGPRREIFIVETNFPPLNPPRQNHLALTTFSSDIQQHLLSNYAMFLVSGLDYLQR